MDDRIATLVEALTSEDEEARAAQLAELEDDALASLLEDLRAASDEYRERDDWTDDDVAEVTRLRDAFQVVQAEIGARAELAAQEAAAAEERAAEAQRVLEEMTPAEAASDEESETDEPETDEPDEAAAVEEPEADEPKVPVRARARRRPALAELARRPAQPEPVEQSRIEAVKPRWQTVVNGQNAGIFLADTQEIAERVNEARQSLIHAPEGFQEKVVVARVEADYPTERHFDAGDDPVDNMLKLEPLLAAARHPETWTEEQRAIVASGGYCAPAEARYDIVNINSQERPVANGLARVGVSRGAINVVQGARLSSIVTGGPGTSGAAISIWTNATDTTPGGSTKQRQNFACRAYQTCELQAIVARARFGNLMTRAFPELIADDVALMMTAHARVAEVALMDCLISAMNMDVAQTGFFGTARDIKDHAMQVASNIRYLERSNTPVRGVVAREILPMIQVDVLNQTASGDTSSVEVNEAFARTLMASTGVNWTYAMDVPTGSDAFQLATDGANLPDWPDNFEIPMFPDGTALFLDGGRLDLGIVRDSTLNNTNDYEMFVETFEGCCYLGPYGMTLTLTTCPNGKSQAASDVTTICTGS